MTLPVSFDSVCGLCGGTLIPDVDGAPIFRCEKCGHEPHAAPLSTEGAVDYLARAALGVILHPAPEPQDVAAGLYRQKREAHVLAVAFLAEALRKLGKAAAA